MLLGEPDALAILDALYEYDEHVASRLLRVELRRLALREGVLDDADRLLSGIALLPVDEAILSAAETVEPANVGTLDAVHLVTALRLFAAGLVETLLTFDVRLAQAARDHGLAVLTPR